MRRLSLVAASGSYSSFWCAVFLSRWLLLLWSSGSRRAGFSSCGTRAQQLWPAGFAVPQHVESSRTRARTRVPCIGRQILNHCTTREALGGPFLAEQVHFRVGVPAGRQLSLAPPVPSWESPSWRTEAPRVRATGFRGKASNLHLPANTFPPPKLSFQSPIWQLAGSHRALRSLQRGSRETSSPAFIPNFAFLHLFFLILSIFVEVELIYSVVPVSAVQQQSDSVIHIDTSVF